MRSMMPWAAVLAAVLLAGPALAQAQTASDMEILRQRLQDGKKLVVTQAMQLTENEAPGFWPVYEAYQADLGALNARLGQLIKAYAAAYRTDTVTNEKAQAFIEEMLMIEEAEVDLSRAYVPRLAAVLSTVKVVRYLQVENKIRTLLKYELAGEIPLAK